MCNYFRHDSNARNDAKLLSLRMKWKSAGYGVYFMLLEKMRDDRSFMCFKDYNVIAFELREDAALVKSVVEDFGLFVFTDDGKYFYSERLMREMEGGTAVVDESVSEKRRRAGRKGGLASGRMRSKTKQNEAKLKQNEAKNFASTLQSGDIKEVERSKIEAKLKQNEAKNFASIKEKESEKEEIPPYPPIEEKEKEKESLPVVSSSSPTRVCVREGEVVDLSARRSRTARNTQADACSYGVGIDGLRNAPVWREQVMMRYGLSQAEIEKWLDVFALECGCTGKRHGSETDMKQHFFNWLRIQLEKQQKQKQDEDRQKVRGGDTPRLAQPNEYTREW